jgi:hypothetical protein
VEKVNPREPHALVLSLQQDPERRRAFHEINKLSIAAREAKDPIFYTYNKLLWLIGWDE